MNSLSSSAELLRWYVEMGADEAIGEVPIDRLRPPGKPATAAVPLPVARAAPLLAERAPPPAAAGAHALAQAAGSLDDLERAVASFEGCALRVTATNTVFLNSIIHSIPEIQTLERLTI